MNDKKDIWASSDRLVNEIGIICAVMGLAIGILGGVREYNFLVDKMRPTTGDVIKVQSASAGGVSYSAEVRLPDGSTCSIGTGRLADEGGDIKILDRSNTDSKGVVTLMLSWNSTGKSATRGTDCGQSAELFIPEKEMVVLISAISGIMPDNMPKSAETSYEGIM